MSFEKSNGYSPVQQEFIWLSEYVNGSYFAEFDYTTKEKNEFYHINREYLKKFGLIGHGMKLYFDTTTGMFSLNDNILNLAYKVGDMEYQLTGSSYYGLYNDIITYKDAYTDADIVNPNQRYSTRISQYNFGFKKKISFLDGTAFNLKALVCIPYNAPAYVEVTIVSNKSMDGELLMKRAGKMVEHIEAPLDENYAGVCQWAIR